MLPDANSEVIMRLTGSHLLYGIHPAVVSHLGFNLGNLIRPLQINKVRKKKSFLGCVPKFTILNTYATPARRGG